MTTPERGAFQYGGAVYPLATSTGNSSLRDADPALYWTLQFFASVLTTHMQARLLAEAVAANVKVPIGSNGTLANLAAAVQYTLPYDPIVVLQEQQFGKFPLLAMHRVSSKWRWRTVARMDRVSQWKVAYVLPPLMGAQREKLQAFINSAVPTILLDRIENMGDPSWNGGADPWGPNYANLEEINLVGDATGTFQIPSTQQGGLVLPAWIGDLEVIERQENVPAAGLGGLVTGIDINISDSSEGAPVDMVDATVEFPDLSALTGFRSIYRSDLGVTATTNQDRASTWATQDSGGGGNLSASTSREPFILRDPDTGRNILRFDDYADQTRLAGTDTALAADTGKTIVACFRLTDSAKRSSVVSVTDGDISNVSFEANTASSAGGLLGLSAGGSSFDTQIPTTPDWTIAVLRVSASTGGTPIASSVRLSIDGVTANLTLKSGAGTWLSLAGSSEVSVGGDPGTLSLTNARVDLGVLAIFASDLSDADAASCVTYCKQWLAGIG